MINVLLLVIKFIVGCSGNITTSFQTVLGSLFQRDGAKTSVISGFGHVIPKLVNVLFNSKDYLQAVFMCMAVVLLLGILYPHRGEELVCLSPRQSQLDTARADRRGVVTTWHGKRTPKGWLGLGTLHRKHLGLGMM